MSTRVRAVIPSDIPIFFEQQRDPEGQRMAAFISRDPDDRAAFTEQWDRILVDDTVVARTILWGQDEIAGYVASFVRLERREVCYWLGRAYWGRGIATAALAALLPVLPRPLLARVAVDNLGSLRVLEKCGFVRVGTEVAHARARGESLVEVLLELG